MGLKMTGRTVDSQRSGANHSRELEGHGRWELARLDSDTECGMEAIRRPGCITSKLRAHYLS